MIEKLTDAGSMFWSALDSRERLVLVYVVGVAALMLAGYLAREERRRREDELVERLAARLDRRAV